MKNKRVLVIEDDADAANVLEAYLKREGYSVSVAGDGLAGMNTALTWKPDLILLDVMHARHERHGNPCRRAAKE